MGAGVLLVAAEHHQLINTTGVCQEDGKENCCCWQKWRLSDFFNLIFYLKTEWVCNIKVGVHPQPLGRINLHTEICTHVYLIAVHALGVNLCC